MRDEIRELTDAELCGVIGGKGRFTPAERSPAFFRPLRTLAANIPIPTATGSAAAVASAPAAAGGGCAGGTCSIR